MDWNEAVKKAVTTGLGMIPEAGEFIEPLVDIFWPNSGNSPWNQIKDQVDQLINQKLNTLVFNQATGKLDSLKQNMLDYLQAIKSSTPAGINSQWITVTELFVNSESSFTTAGYEVMLLPLYAQFVNMYLSILRDPLLPTKPGSGVLNGTSWGMTDANISDLRTRLQKYITGAHDYTTTWYNNGRTNVAKIERDDAKVEPFRSTNAYNRQMTMLVLDYMDSWTYYDVTAYPNGAPTALFTREIYSDPYGNRVNVDRNTPAFALPSQATQFPTQVVVWGNKDIGAVQLTYPAGGGPGGVTTTSRMGDNKSGNPNTFYPSANEPILGVSVSYDYPGNYNLTMVINTLQFTLGYSGTTPILSPQLGQKLGQFRVNVGYDNYALSSIYIDGVNESLGQYANCIVFGFKRFSRP
ncbi:delta endotoxin-like protein [Larkinella arboricola]|uniref:Delta endotoxin-like protein n=2 Tax=Larkinella arboricola TaxID=643671 RepID=A0A327WNG4_LARAB|nr:delta endotoxin-like protein [Larkinella arboricola]